MSALLLLLACGGAGEGELPPEPAPDTLSQDTDTDLGTDTDTGTPDTPTADTSSTEGPPCGEPVLATDHAQLLRWPYLQDPRTDSMVVVWGGGVDSTEAVLRLGTTAVFDLEFVPAREEIEGSAEELALYTARATGLSPATTYCYEVELDGVVVSRGETLRTASSDPASTLEMLAIGDMGAGTKEQYAVRDAMVPLAAGADLLLTLGDNAYEHGDWHELHDHVFGVYQDMMQRAPTLTTPGNHDYQTLAGAPYYANFVLPEQAWLPEEQEAYWSADLGPVHLVGLDSHVAVKRPGEQDMVAWLEADLAASDKPWTIVAWHHPVLTGHPDRQGSLLMVMRVVPILQAHGVDLVLSGHDHFYERFGAVTFDGPEAAADPDGIPYITSGGGGRFLYEVEDHPLDEARAAVHHFLSLTVDECTLSVDAVGTDGITFDTLALSRCP